MTAGQISFSRTADPWGLVGSEIPELHLPGVHRGQDHSRKAVDGISNADTQRPFSPVHLLRRY